MSSSQHYALVSRSDQLVVTPPPQEEDDSNGRHVYDPAVAGASSTTNAMKHVRTELELLYQSYAEMYPNPRLSEEARERDKLLEAASAAANANTRPKKQSKRSGGGWSLASFFGFGKSEVNDYAATAGAEDTEHDDYNAEGGDHDLDPLIYTEQKSLNDDHHDDDLCGTTLSLDTSCIPDEAYTVARFHLTSTRTRRGDQPNLVRRLLARRGSTSATDFSYVIVGLGCIAEFPSGAGERGRDESPSMILTTSDRDDLLTYSTSTSQDNHNSTRFRIEQVRAVSIGTNCLAVSWGFEDGLIIFYRRMELSQTETGENKANRCLGWHAVWMLGPSQPVLDDMSDLFHQDSEDGIPGSPLLKVSDMIPLMVDSPTNNAPNNTGMEQPTTVVTLAVARLGGIIEYVPLPTALWIGGEIPVSEQQKLKRNQQRKRKRRQGQHYAIGSDISIGVQDQTVAITTWDYHGDIMCLEAFRTEVTADTEWDSRAFPESPPSEFVVAATGTSKEHGRETITFWSLSTIFTDDVVGSQQQQRPGHVGFQLHAALIEAVTASSGADVSIFATRNIMKRWRTPRNVQLREDAGFKRENRRVASQSTTVKDRVTTISTTAPIVGMRFVKSNGVSNESHATRGPFLAILDWNGSVTIMDCSFMERLASQRLSQNEYNMYSNANDNMPFPLATTVVARTDFTNRLRKYIISSTNGDPQNVTYAPPPICVANLHWLGDPLVSKNDDILPPLVLLAGNTQRKLYIASFAIQDKNDPDADVKGRKDAVLTSLPFPGNGAALQSLDDGQVAFVAIAHRKRNSRKMNKGFGFCLKFFIMQQLQSLAIIESLARAGKYHEAIQSAGNLSETKQAEISTLVQHCHKQLWETTEDVDSLAAVDDVEYIVKETLARCSTNLAPGHQPGGRAKLDKSRSICFLALDRAKHYNPVNSEDTSIEDITTFLVKLGTYELLCQQLSVDASYTVFYNEFSQLDLSELAVTFARTADILALSTLFFRHSRHMIMKSVEILGNIPLSIDPTSYRHLLPIIREDGRISDCFLSEANDQNLHYSQMPQYLKDNDNHFVVLDRRDETMVLDHNKHVFTGSVDDTGDRGDLVSSVATWFVSRSCKMQSFIGSLPPVILLCEYGLRCTISSETIDQKRLIGGPRAVQDLYRTWKSACSLQSLLAEGVVDLNQAGGNSVVSISTSDLLAMDLVDIVALVLHGETDSDKILSKFSTYLQPLLIDVTSVPFSEQTGQQTDLDHAFTSYCLGLVGGISELEDEIESEVVDYARHALASCAAVTSCSKASTARPSRLIKDMMALCEMVLAVIQEVSAAFSKRTIPVSDTRAIIDLMWNMYEALPEHVPATMLTADELIPLLKKADVIFQDLVGVDILSRWPGCRPFSFFCNMQDSRVEEDSSRRITSMGTRTVAELCRSFCSVVNNGMTLDGTSSRDLLRDLVSDLKQFLQVCYEASLTIGPTLCEHLVRPLLLQEQFHFVAEFLRDAPADFVDRQQVTREVLSFTNEAVFSKDPDDSKIRSAIRCQDVIGPAFPDLHAGFLSVRRFLDAANFINTVIYGGMGAQKPCELRHKLPLDVVESILADHPSSIVCGCPEWSDASYAFEANKKLRDQDALEDRREASDLPSLPGGAIFHLATVLGLEDDVSALVVKCRVSHHAITEGLYGAAAAICRTLVCAGKSHLGSEAEAHAKLSAVAELVLEERYDDIFTKKELCASAINKFEGILSFDNCSSFDAIIRASMFLDQRTSLFSQERQVKMPEPNNAAFMRPGARLFNHIRAEYKADVHALFSDLLGQTAQGEVHDSLMDALSRFVIYWSVADSIMLKASLDASAKADARDVLALGCSLILHIPSQETAVLCIEELLKIAVDQATTVATEERFGSVSFSKPDPDVVDHLLGMGYSENGARRSAVMTQNSGLDAALAWAMTHSSDHDFDNPFVVVQLPNQQCIDEAAIQALQKTLFAVKYCLEDESSLNLFLCHLMASRKVGTGMITGPGAATRNGIAAEPPIASSTRQMTSKPGTKRKPPPPPPPRQTTTKVGKAVSEKANYPKSSSGVVSRSLPSPGRSSGSDRAPPPPPPSSHKMPTDAAKAGKPALKPPAPPADTIQPGAALPARRPLLNREELRKRGQAALSRLRTNPAVNALPDRRRLIEKGRNFLTHAKAKSPVGTGILDTQKPFGPAPSQSARQIGPPQRQDEPKSTAKIETGSLAGSVKQHQASNGNDFPAVAPETDDDIGGGQIEAESDDASEDSGWGFQDDFDV